MTFANAIFWARVNSGVHNCRYRVFAVLDDGRWRWTYRPGGGGCNA